jgi:GNAT superfamily N-acetyltransferase
MSGADSIETEAGEFRVRRAQREDLPFLVALLAADAVAAGRGDDAEDLTPYEQAFTAIAADPHQFLSCLQAPDGTIVGTLQLTLIPGLSRRGMMRAQIEAVRIADTARGVGLGTGFLRWAIEWARGQGCGLVQLTTDTRRHDAYRFYERLSFAHSHHGLKLDLRSPAG